MKTISHLFGRRRQKTVAALFMLGIALGMLPPEVKAQTPTTVNILSPDSNPYEIEPGSGDYIIQGFNTQTANRIHVKSGYEGTITLDNVNIVCAQHYAPIRIYGLNDCDTENPVTKVNLILKGSNNLDSGGAGTMSVAAALQVDQGAQIRINAIDPADNASGSLYAISRYSMADAAGAAGIGGACVRIPGSGAIGSYGDSGPNGYYTGNYMYQGQYETYTSSKPTSGGNILINSGTIYARGGTCGAGIGGGGWGALYLGNIVITGGDITAVGGEHAPGIGGGCVDGEANNGSYAPNSCVIAVPPAKIEAYCLTYSNNTNTGGKGLSGANYIVYIGDPQSKRFTVYTEDYRATTMYLDLSGDPDVKRKLELFAPTRDPKRMYLGESKPYPDDLPLWNSEFTEQPIVQNYGTFSNSITFFTDAKNDRGFEYVPSTATYPQMDNVTVQLNAPVYEPVMTMTKYVPPYGALSPMDTADLLLGYDATEAIGKAVTLTFRNNGNTNLYNMEIEFTAPYHTAADGSSLDAKIQAELAAALTTDASGTYFAPGDEFQVLARLNTGLGVGTYTGSVRFNADNVPAFVTKSQTFSVNVVRILLPPPDLATLPGGISETNTTVDVEATFVRPVSGLTDIDIQSTGSTVSGMTPVGGSPSDKWQFTVTPAVSLSSGQYIQLYAKENIAYDDHLIRTDDRSEALNIKYNTDSPYATFSFPFDIAPDSIFITAQSSFTIALTANGSGDTDADSLWSGVSLLSQSLVVPAISMEKDGLPYADFIVSSYVWDDAARVHTVTVSALTSFDEGDYRIILANGIIRNNISNLLEETVSGFKVRIPEIVPGPSYPGTGIGYGIEPDPVSLPYQGGDVLLTVYGKHLQYAEAMGILKIQLPAAILGGIQVAPHAATDGLTATITVPAPGNNTVTPVSHAFTLFLDGVMPDPDAIGYTTVAAAPAITVDPVEGKWFGNCEYEFTATIPDDGTDREVNLTYLGLAENYLAMQGGVRPPATVKLRSGETQLYLLLKTLRVPDNLNGGTGAIVVSSPGLPSDTSAWFQFYNSPTVNIDYIPRTTMYPGKLELNIKGGSPTLERSFNDITWESAWLPVTPLQISNLEGMVYFREPDGCEADMHFHIDGFYNGGSGGTPQIAREVTLPDIPSIITDPGPGVHRVNSGEDFTFTVTLTGPYSGMVPEVTTDRQLLSDEEGITVEPLEDGVFSVTNHAIRENFSISITAEADINQGIESADGPRVWTSDGQLHIYAVRSGEARVYTLTGALVKSYQLVGGRTNSTTLQTGFYVVMTFSDGQRYKVVIQ